MASLLTISGRRQHHLLEPPPLCLRALGWKNPCLLASRVRPSLLPFRSTQDLS